MQKLAKRIYEYAQLAAWYCLMRVVYTNIRLALGYSAAKDIIGTTPWSILGALIIFVFIGPVLYSVAELYDERKSS